jgi:hypothetical protein
MTSSAVYAPPESDAVDHPARCGHRRSLATLGEADPIGPRALPDLPLKTRRLLA